jgi:tetratricopeptide (TPR) repeat protein
MGDHERALVDYDMALSAAPTAAWFAERAEIHADFGQYEPAEADYERALTLEPTLAAAHVARAQLLMTRGEYETAAEELSAALEGGETNPETRRLRGIAYEGLGMYDRAHADYDAVVTAAPSADALCDRADVLRTLDQPDAAEEDYRRALELDIGCVRARIGRARLRGVRGEYAEALEDLSAALANDTDDLEAHELRALALGSLGRHADAAADLKWAVQRAPDAGVYCDLGDSLMELEDFAAARDAYARAIELDERFERAYVGRGYAQGREQDLEPARQDLCAALDLSPDDHYARAILAMVLETMGRSEEALGEYDRLLDAVASAEIFKRRGALRQALGRVQGAEGDYRSAVEVDREDVWAYVALGRLHIQTEDYAAAREAFDAAVEIDAGNVPAHIGRGDAMAGLSELEQAILDYDRALELDPRDVGALRARSSTRQQLAESFRARRLYPKVFATYVEALDDLDQAIGLAPTDPSLYAQKAVVLRVLEAYDLSIQVAVSGLAHAEADESPLTTSDMWRSTRWGGCCSSAARGRRSLG